MTAIVYPAPFVVCQTSPTRGVRRKVGGAQDGALGRRLSVRQERKALYYIILSLCVCLCVRMRVRVRALVCVRFVCVYVYSPSYSACQAYAPYCIAICGLSRSTLFSTQCHKRHSLRGKKLSNINCVFRSSVQL